MQIQVGMPVKSSEGTLVGTVAHVRNEYTLELAGSGGSFLIPTMWVLQADDFVQLMKTADEVKAGSVPPK